MMMTALTSAVRDLPDALPDVLPGDGRFVERLAGRRLVVFLDYDGVLTPMRDTVRALAQRCTVCVVSGRDRAVVEELMGVDDLVVAGSRGFDIWSPNGGEIQHDAASGFSGVVEAAYRLRAELGSIPGVVVKPKRVSVAVRYRLVDQDQRDRRATTAVRGWVRHRNDLPILVKCGDHVLQPAVLRDPHRETLVALVGTAGHLELANQLPHLTAGEIGDPIA
jgi:trehalose 6-phosphate phosphatase